MSSKTIKTADTTHRRPSWILGSRCRDKKPRPNPSERAHLYQAISLKKSIHIGIVSKLTSCPGLYLDSCYFSFTHLQNVTNILFQHICFKWPALPRFRKKWNFHCSLVFCKFSKMRQLSVIMSIMGWGGDVFSLNTEHCTKNRHSKIVKNVF